MGVTLKNLGLSRAPGQLVRCTLCGEEKPWGAEHFKAVGGKPRLPCRACQNRARTERAARDPGHTRAAGRDRMARWREGHPEQVKAANRGPRSFDRERANDRINRWRREHPETRRVEFQRRKALAEGLPNTLSMEDWERCRAYWGDWCCICGRVAGGGYVLAIEHWIPLSDPRPDNPGTVPGNILPMCHARRGVRGGCNNAKWTRDPVAWLTGRLGVQAARAKLTEINAYFNAVTPPAARDLIAAVAEAITGEAVG